MFDSSIQHPLHTMILHNILMLADVNNEPAKLSANWFNPVICQRLF